MFLQQMQVVEITAPGGPEVLRLTQRPISPLQEDEVLIRVAYAGVNRADLLQRQGRYDPPPGTTDIPGLEVSGEVVEIGSKVPASYKGQKVCALLAGGGYAEYVAVPVSHCLPVPSNLTLAQAAALPEAIFTVWANIFILGQLKRDEKLLIHGGASGIGTIAIQMAVARGAQVFVTAGTSEKCQLCESLGAYRAINYRQEDFVKIIQDLTQGAGVNLVLDMVGGDYVMRNLKLLSPQGRHVSIAYQQGREAAIDLSTVMRKRLTLTGSTLRDRSTEEKASLARQVQQEIWPLIEKGHIQPIVHAQFSLPQVAEAHRLMQSGEHSGKIILKVANESM